MVKQKGTILKFKNNLAIIMTNDCKIVSIIKQPGMYVGLEISFNENEIINRKKNLAFSCRIAAGVAAIFIVMLVCFNPFGNSGVYAYVAIDSNTSIEFELDKNNKILKVNCYNDDTNSLLNELDLKNQSVDFAIKEVIKKLNLNESTVLISACLNEQSKKKSISPVDNESIEFSKLIDICKSAVETNISENIESKVVEVPYDYKKLADANKISIGRSIVYEKAKEQGIDFDIEEIKTKSIEETLQKVKIDDVGVVHNVKKVESNRPAPESPKKDSPKEKPIPKDKNDQNPIVEPKDKPEEKPHPELKDKPDEKPYPEPKDKPDEKPYPEPKDKPDEKPYPEPKDKPDEKPYPEPKDKPDEKPAVEPKGSLEEKPISKPKNSPEAKPKDDLQGQIKVELKDSPKEKSEDHLKGKPEHF